MATAVLETAFFLCGLLVLLRDCLHGTAFVQECRQRGRDAWITLIRFEGAIEGVAFAGQNLSNFAHPLA